MLKVNAMENLSSVPKRVIIVDDDSGMRRALRMLLERRGYSVEEWETGDELLSSLADETLAPPYCVILDLHLEGINGLETRQRMGRTDIPVILITGDTKATDLVGDSRFHSVMFKPLDWLALCSQLQGIRSPEIA